MYTFECTLKRELRSSCSITHVAGTRARSSLYSAAMADSVHADARPTGVHDVGGLDDDAPLDLREKPLAFWERQVLSCTAAQLLHMASCGSLQHQMGLILSHS